MESTENLDFHRYWCILKRRWLPALSTLGAVLTLTYLYTFSRVPIYRVQGQLLFKQDKASSLIGLGSAQQLNSQNGTMLTTAEVIRSANILRKVIDRVNQNSSQETPLTLGDLQQGLEITNNEGVDVLRLEFTSSDPKLAALIVNQIMDAYVEHDLATNRAAAVSAGNFITDQLPKVKGNVARADAALRSFKEKNKITDLAQTQAAVAGNIERIGAQIDAVKTQLADSNSRFASIQAKLGMSAQQAMAVGSLSQSLAVQGVLTDFQAVQRQLANARSRYKESSPVIVDLKDKQTQLRNLLQAQAAQVLQGQATGPNGSLQVGQIQQQLMADLIATEVNRKALVTQMATLSDQQAFYQQKAAILPRWEQQQREELRELAAAQGTYETLLKNLQDIKVLENKTVGNVQVIEAAEVPSVPIGPNKMTAMAAGSLAGILLAIAVVFVLEVRDKKIKTVREARELFEYTLLGTIPVFGQATQVGDSGDQTAEVRRWLLPVLEQPRSGISESYRMLQANLNFTNVDKTLKVIVVTSSVPKEGKSTTCANLAAVMAQLDYRVLIIDADLRHPSQHQIWQIPNQVGLIDVISGQANLRGGVIQKAMNNLYVITAGVLSSNLDVFLDSRRMATLIGQCPKQYDYVIIDTPPLAIAADASIIGKMADGVLLVTRPGLADSISSKSAKEYLDQADINILGIVVNGVLLRNEPHSYYHYAEG